MSTCDSSPCNLAAHVHFVVPNFLLFFIAPVSWQRVRPGCLLYSLFLFTHLGSAVHLKTAPVLVHRVFVSHRKKSLCLKRDFVNMLQLIAQREPSRRDPLGG